LLLEWGLESYLKNKIVEPEGISFRRWENGNVIGYTKLIPDFRETFKAPYYVVHRAHFHDALYQLALQLGVEVKINQKVVEYDEDAPSVTVEDGTATFADLIVAADGGFLPLYFDLRYRLTKNAAGVKSLARKHILGGKDKEPLKTGFAAYRATVDVAKMQQDPDTSWLLNKPGLNIW
jgi:salicylate hydroxylase